MGALVPDADVWAMFIIERLRGASGCEVFHYRYWEQPWTTLQILLNSIPVYFALLALSLGGLLVPDVFAAQGRVDRARIRPAPRFCMSGQTSCCIMRMRARSGLPFTDWIFRSPVSLLGSPATTARFS